MKNNKLLLNLGLWGVLMAMGGAWLISSLVQAGDTNLANAEGKSFADSLNSSQVNSAVSNLNVTDVPNYAGPNVQETNYYNSGMNIENQAQVEAGTNPNAQYIINAKTARPQITIDSQTDPLFKRHDEITTKANNLSETYTGCVDLPVGTQDITKYAEKTCNVTGYQNTVNFNCVKNLNITCSNANAGMPNPFQLSDFVMQGADGMLPGGSNGDTFWYGNPTANNRSGNCVWFENTIKFYVSDKNAIPEFILQQVAYDDWLTVSINGHVAFTGIGGMTWVGFNNSPVSGTYPCEHKGIRTYDINVDAKPKLVLGWNTIYIRNLVGVGGSAYLKFRLRRIHVCNTSESISYTCPSGESQASGTLLSSTCTAGPETRFISGFPVWKSCWQWNNAYTRLDAPHFVKEQACFDLEGQGCGQTTAVCTNHNGTFCENQVITYSCPYQTASRHVALCGSQLVCPDGNCTSEFGQTYLPATDDFKKAATGLEVAAEIAKDFDQNNLTVFTGDDKACSQSAGAVVDCCKDSGWGLDAGLASCSAEEQELGLKKQASQVVYVGSYCSEDTILGCISTKHVYCAYPTKLARIVIEQGKAQLGQNYGVPQGPNCSGFTLQELESLNFDAMDLSEFYSDVMSKAINGSTPDPTGAAQNIETNLKNTYPQIK